MDFKCNCECYFHAPVKHFELPRVCIMLYKLTCLASHHISCVSSAWWLVSFFTLALMQMPICCCVMHAGRCQNRPESDLWTDVLTFRKYILLGSAHSGPLLLLSYLVKSDLFRNVTFLSETEWAICVSNQVKDLIGLNYWLSSYRAVLSAGTHTFLNVPQCKWEKNRSEHGQNFWEV